MSSPKLEFNFQGMAVGCFEAAEYPRSDGRYRYMPYRGPGHYRMQEALRTRGSARCYYKVGIGRVYFTVLSCPEYGVLELSAFGKIPVSWIQRLLAAFKSR